MSAKLNRSITLTFERPGSEPREYEVKFPNTGQLMDIDLLRLRLSDGQYEKLRYSFTPSFILQANRIDAIATFATLIPQMKKDLNVASFLELDFDYMKIVVDVYVDQYLPWYEQWMTALTNPPKEEQKEKNEDKGA